MQVLNQKDYKLKLAVIFNKRNYEKNEIEKRIERLICNGDGGVGF
ncbi:hypothetical protein CHRYSEO8AT_440109 [Chryseobacterium sp. 8AT]|nr:hypothetical protein CHRYSEO8AT_440109 [Chryseobacterium sp. 8AT]